MKNVIHITPQAAEFIRQIDQEPQISRRKYSQQISLRDIRRNSLMSFSKEISYYANQKYGPQMVRDLQQSLVNLETFKVNNSQIPRCNFIDRKLRQLYTNLNYTDEQKCTQAQRLNKIAMKHKEQVEQIQKIQSDVNKRYQQQIDKSSENYYETPDFDYCNRSILRMNKHRENSLQNLQEKKYQYFWNRLPKSLVK